MSWQRVTLKGVTGKAGFPGHMGKMERNQHGVQDGEKDLWCRTGHAWVMNKSAKEPNKPLDVQVQIAGGHEEDLRLHRSTRKGRGRLPGAVLHMQEKTNYSGDPNYIGAAWKGSWSQEIVAEQSLLGDGHGFQSLLDS